MGFTDQTKKVNPYRVFERSVFNFAICCCPNFYQARFCPKNSTPTTVIQMCDERFENMDQGELIFLVFLDIRKAFDSKAQNIAA